MAISSFEGKNRFLSNFWHALVRLHGEKYVYDTVEAAYQAAKTLDPEERAAIRLCCSPGEAKRLGRKATLRLDWEKVKLTIMEDLLRQKFAWKELKEKLLSTGDEELVEGNTWSDTFWGVCNGKGENHLGKLLMKIREELKEKQSHELSSVRLQP